MGECGEIWVGIFGGNAGNKPRASRPIPPNPSKNGLDANFAGNVKHFVTSPAIFFAP